jgi:uncharacterized membrane protein YagU involved in acid resistance
MKRSPLCAIAIAWLVAGCLDITSALVIHHSRGITSTRGLQGIAVGLIGREEAFQGGTSTAALGLVLHFFIMFCVVLVFFVGTRFMPILMRHPLISGLVYGPLVYLVMYWVVVPISRIGPRPHTLYNDAIAILIHICLIGIPIALIAARCSQPKISPSHV